MDNRFWKNETDLIYIIYTFKGNLLLYIIYAMEGNYDIDMDGVGCWTDEEEEGQQPPSSLEDPKQTIDLAIAEIKRNNP